MDPAWALQRFRIAWYRPQWTCAKVVGRPELRSPALLAGAGTIHFDGAVTLGWQFGPGYLSGYSYREARHPEAQLRLGDGTHLNNAVTLVSEGPGISIGRRCLVGPDLHVYDSDFHPVAAFGRANHAPEMAPVEIGDDVFVGTAALVLKGVTIGDGGVIAAGAVVSSDVAPGEVVAGNPARARRR